MNDILKRLTWFLCGCIAIAIIFVSTGITQAETFQELSVPYGFGVDHYTGLKVEYTYGKALSNHWEVGIKGHIGLLMYEEEHYTGLQTGVGPIVRYVYPVGDNRTSLFIDIRPAIGYAQSPNKHLIESGITCFAEGNVGIRTAITKKVDGVLGFNFSHISSSRPSDRGLNMYGPVVGIKW